jgi:hypothetical protein
VAAAAVVPRSAAKSPALAYNLGNFLHTLATRSLEHLLENSPDASKNGSDQLPRPPFGVPGLRPPSAPPGGLVKTRQQRKNPPGLGFIWGIPGYWIGSCPGKLAAANRTATKPGRAA